MPAMVKAVERLADSYEGKRNPRMQELIDHGGYLVAAVEKVMITRSVPKLDRGVSARMSAL